MLGNGSPVGNGVIDTGDGRLLFTDIKRVLANKYTRGLRYNYAYELSILKLLFITDTRGYLHLQSG